jgi:hypothetical protein
MATTNGTVKVVTDDARISKIITAYRAAFARDDWAACWDLAGKAIREWTWRMGQTHKLHEGGMVDTRTGRHLGRGTQFCEAQRDAWFAVQRGLKARFPQDDEYIF